MKLLKKLMPLTAIVATTAVVAPILTSCNKDDVAGEDVGGEVYKPTFEPKTQGGMSKSDVQGDYSKALSENKVNVAEEYRWFGSELVEIIKNQFKPTNAEEAKIDFSTAKAGVSNFKIENSLISYTADLHLAANISYTRTTDDGDKISLNADLSANLTASFNNWAAFDLIDTEGIKDLGFNFLAPTLPFDNKETSTIPENFGVDVSLAVGGNANLKYESSKRDPIEFSGEIPGISFGANITNTSAKVSSSFINIDASGLTSDLIKQIMFFNELPGDLSLARILPYIGMFGSYYYSKTTFTEE